MATQKTPTGFAVVKSSGKLGKGRFKTAAIAQAQQDRGQARLGGFKAAPARFKAGALAVVPGTPASIAQRKQPGIWSKIGKVRDYMAWSLPEVSALIVAMETKNPDSVSRTETSLRTGFSINADGSFASGFRPGQMWIGYGGIVVRSIWHGFTNAIGVRAPNKKDFIGGFIYSLPELSAVFSAATAGGSAQNKITTLHQAYYMNTAGINPRLPWAGGFDSIKQFLKLNLPYVVYTKAKQLARHFGMKTPSNPFKSPTRRRITAG